jgi:alanyl-tRNA synthetase
MKAEDLRATFTDFWVSKGHQARASASLIPHEKSLLFTVAGMVPFMPYFLGEEVPPSPRITTIQKCVRAGGKHNDLDDIGRTNRHFTFFEMMGNFSFGDYFKAEAIPWAWEFFTEVLGLDGDKLWVTVHVSDDEAEEMWKSLVGVPAERIQRLDKDNWWAAGDTGPCGPCSEIFYDLGPEHGADGGPAHGGESRFIEVWNLVFMQYSRGDDGELVPLPATGIDTGAGLERILTVLQGVETAWDIDIFQELLAEASRITGVAGGQDPELDVSLRIFADHARAVTFLISDGVFPSNEDRGYVLRRIIRRAVRHAYVLGVTNSVMTQLVDAVIDVMGGSYPDLVKNQSFIRDVVGNEEERFRRTLATGSQILDAALADVEPGGQLPGSVAFQLHDTYGFPIELTEEILAEREFTVDRGGFDQEMDVQRTRARSARTTITGASTEVYRDILESHGPTDFVRDSPTTQATVLAVLEVEGADTIEIILDTTTFYAEGGGQVGDVGTIETANGSARVLDTTSAVPGLTRHTAEVLDGVVEVGSAATTVIDWERRAAIRRNHTGTHLLHLALREVLGEHVQQAGSHVDDQRLRFDFSHFEAVTDDQLAAIEDLVNQEVLENESCRHYETSMENAQSVGAIAFFGDKYGDTVRVLEAGSKSIELCGGTHVRALGDIGHLRIVSESSIGSNLRRIEAVTGTTTVERLRRSEAQIAEIAELLGSTAEDVVDALQRRLSEAKALRQDVKSLQQQAASGHAGDLVSLAVDGVIVTRVDNLERETLRDMALAARDHEGVEAVVIAGAPEGGGVVLIAAVEPGGRFVAADLITESAKTVQGGFGRKGDPPFIMAGGRNVDGIDEALDQARAAAGVSAPQ